MPVFGQKEAEAAIPSIVAPDLIRGYAFLLLRTNGKEPSPVSPAFAGAGKHGATGVKEARHFLHARQWLSCARLFPIAGRVVAGPPGSNKPPSPVSVRLACAVYFIEKEVKIAWSQSGHSVRFVRLQGFWPSGGFGVDPPSSSEEGRETWSRSGLVAAGWCTQRARRFAPRHHPQPPPLKRRGH